MGQYAVKRILLAVLSLFGITMIVFLLLRVIPADAALVALSQDTLGQEVIDDELLAQKRLELGLDKPVHEQYWLWLSGIPRGDLGKSLINDRPVWEEIKIRFPVTIQLALMTAFLSWTLAILLGTISAVRQNTKVDYLVRIFSVTGLTMPTFWSATLIILVLVSFFNWIPPFTYLEWWNDPWKSFQQLIFPAIALGYFSSAGLARLTRSSVLEELRLDYTRTAYSKGLSRKVIIYRHVLKNALLPVVTLMGLQLAALLGGTAIIESIFNIAGMGNYLIESIRSRDYLVIQSLVTIFGSIVILANLFVDILYGFLNPRIRYQ